MTEPSRARFRVAASALLLVGASLATTAAAAQDTTMRPGESVAEPDQSGLATPEAFRFRGHMANVWQRSEAEAIAQDAPVTLPLMIHDAEPFEEGVYVWDAWPMRNPDGSIAEVDGWVVMVGLSAGWDEAAASDYEFYTLSTWRYWYTRDGEWRPGGLIFSREEALGSRQWAGSTVFDPDANTATFYYTAVGALDAPSLEADEPPRDYAVHHPAAGRPNTEQRLAAVTATVVVGPEGVSFENPGEHRMLMEADGRLYSTEETYVADTVIYGFRDPEYVLDQATGEERILFTANAAGVTGPSDGAIGMATRTDDGGWRLEPPILVSVNVSAQLERPHVVYRDGGVYLFFSTHDFTFAEGIAGPRGLYGFWNPDGTLTGRFTPLNGHGLVAANPIGLAQQAYSFLVLPDGLVMSYLNESYGSDQDPDAEQSFVGAPAPMFRLGFDGDVVTVAGFENRLGE